MPMSGIKVVEACSNIAGPLTGTIFGDLGADVIKIEKPVAATTHAVGRLHCSMEWAPEIPGDQSQQAIGDSGAQEPSTIEMSSKGSSRRQTYSFTNMRPGVANPSGYRGRKRSR